MPKPVIETCQNHCARGLEGITTMIEGLAEDDRNFSEHNYASIAQSLERLRRAFSRLRNRDAHGGEERRSLEEQFEQAQLSEGGGLRATKDTPPDTSGAE